MDPETKKDMDIIDAKLNAIYASVEKTRKYFLWTLISSAVFFILPLVGIALILPSLMSTLSSSYTTLEP